MLLLLTLRSVCAAVLSASSALVLPDAPTIATLLGRWGSGPEREVVRFDAAEASAGPLGDERRLVHVAARGFAALGSKSQATAALKRRDLLLNGETVEGCRRVSDGDLIELNLPQPKRLAGDALDARVRFVRHLLEQGLSVLYEDEALAVVRKPAGVHTKRNTNPKYGALEDALPAILEPPDLSCMREVIPRPDDVGDEFSGKCMDEALPLPLAMHRLDVRVRGLCVVAKSRIACARLSRAFESRRVTKTYHALIVGHLPEAVLAAGEITSPVSGMEARTLVRELRREPHVQWGYLSRVELKPITGRTHQLRVHMASLGTPIVGDDLYWDLARESRAAAAMRPDAVKNVLDGSVASGVSSGEVVGAACELLDALPNVRRGGLFLESCAVQLQHPWSGEEVAVCADDLPRFDQLLDKAVRGVAVEEEGSEGGNN